MPVLDNNSPFPCVLFAAAHASGALSYTAVVRGTFDIGPGGETAPSREQDPIVAADVYHGDEGTSSIRYESDLTPTKPGTDVVMIGAANAPEGRAVTSLQVSLRIGDLRKTIDVIGDRLWDGFGMTAAEPFTEMPLVYERAYGGFDPASARGPHSAFFRRNPVGRGFAGSRLDPGTPLPNIESPGRRMTSPKDRPDPEGFGFVSRFWEPRSTLGGTMDDDWRKSQFPLPPTDFNPDYFQGAHPDLICRPHLRGDEPVEIAGMAAEGPLRFRLPGVAAGVSVHRRRRNPETRLAALDTVIFRPNERKLNLVWHATAYCARTLFDVGRMVVFKLSIETAMALRREIAEAPYVWI